MTFYVVRCYKSCIFTELNSPKIFRTSRGDCVAALTALSQPPPLSPNIFLHHCTIDTLMWGIKIHPGVNTIAQYYTFGMPRSNPPGQPRVVSPGWTSNHLHQPPPGGRTLAIARLPQPPQDDFLQTVIWLVEVGFLSGIQSSRW